MAGDLVKVTTPELCQRFLVLLVSLLVEPWSAKACAMVMVLAPSNFQKLLVAWFSLSLKVLVQAMAIIPSCDQRLP